MKRSEFINCLVRPNRPPSLDGEWRSIGKVIYDAYEETQRRGTDVEKIYLPITLKILIGDIEYYGSGIIGRKEYVVVDRPRAVWLDPLSSGTVDMKSRMEYRYTIFGMPIYFLLGLKKDCGYIEGSNEEIIEFKLKS